MDIKSITAENRNQINEFLIYHWFSTDMAVRGELVDMRTLAGFIAYERENIVGLVMYQIVDKECEIMSLDSLKEGKGIGTSLVDKVIEKSTELGCRRIKLITTNDNIKAIKFYQRRGFDMVNLYINAVVASRKLKPSIPMIGDFGIPIKHEIEFEKKIK
ncbi:GNAT family N-acetyltransferase [Clostridium sp. 19966]|uniref:GNAT family N-acetyltransferase n=1 Tax=Clostridium sp. 19966 TaxID=2768166 RepID=UPI0028DF7E83|nr:GNAT family N-acetyltransferase [Clostridium sp. 19966]MDT8717962.1 GNAT family N-acetyltransferase [Clostridium sp. 19966]